MHVNTDSKPYDTINVTPMLDLAYVLLVVFILMTTATIQGLNISMPKPSNKPSTEHHEVRIIQVTPSGAVLLNGVGVTAQELETQLTALQSRDPQFSVAIKGDPTTQYDKVIAVIDLCNRLKVNMGLVTSRIGT
jgi:biopolymer transport protein ExbD